MMTAYKGDTPKFEIEIQFEGATLLPTDAKIANVLVTVFAKQDTGVILGKYALKTLGGYTPMVIAADKAYIIVETASGEANKEYAIQVETRIVDVSYPSGIAIDTGTGDLFKLKEKV